MSCGQVKNSLIVYLSLARTSYLVTGQVKILMYLPGGQVKILDFFTPVCINSNISKSFDLLVVNIESRIVIQLSQIAFLFISF